MRMDSSRRQRLILESKEGAEETKTEKPTAKETKGIQESWYECE